jgi:rubrerythrin
MRKIFESSDSMRVGHYQSMLESDGIQTFVKNLNQSSLMGEIPFAEVYPELWIVNDDDHEQALRLLQSYEQPAAGNAEDWICPKCGEQVPKELNQCWSCDRPQSAAD